jgi:hypothetical protein
MECGCGKKKGEVGYGKGKAATKKVEAKPAASMKKMGKKK